MSVALPETLTLTDLVAVLALLIFGKNVGWVRRIADAVAFVSKFIELLRAVPKIADDLVRLMEEAERLEGLPARLTVLLAHAKPFIRDLGAAAKEITDGKR